MNFQIGDSAEGEELIETVVYIEAAKAY